MPAGQNPAVEGRHPSTENVLKWLKPSKPVKARNDISTMVAEEIAEAAEIIVDMIKQDSPELTAGLRKLLEAKDCFVRAALDEHPGFWTDR